MWFRRDLRLGDHPGLSHATREDRLTVPVFVIDPNLVRHSGAPRLAFMYRSLRSLDASMGGRLIVRHGDPHTVIAHLAAEVGADEVVVTRDYAPYGRRRDAAVAGSLAEQGVRLVGRDTPYAIAPGGVLKDDGTPYAVFTPFMRAWRRTGWPVPADDAQVRWLGADRWPSDGVPDDPQISCVLPPAGERAAHERWAEFVATALDGYDAQRDTPGVAGTSMMSPYLRWGQVHPRQLLHDLGDSRAHDVYRSELAWREFYAHVMFHKPDSARENLQQKMNVIQLDTDAAALGRFELWALGRTGYPIVDAGMRQLLATGWMHNRVRMIVASFLVKDLHLPWQWGARHFMRHLVDGDLASNQHGWQWSAGTGTDAAPYFRIFNPIAQSERFDGDGSYIRHWVPELAGLTNKAIHAPWKAAHPLPAGAAAPMVDHAVERTESLRRYQTAMGR
ncbi:unannotated protein [freshwater metagenome]|uniref:Unannotated protein n=1 Tax=freshwater metagenome TaxID=449393 RepID=A0A6J7DZT5_9ZZZZ